MLAGISVTAVVAAPQTAVYFWVYETAKKMVRRVAGAQVVPGCWALIALMTRRRDCNTGVALNR